MNKPKLERVMLQHSALEEDSAFSKEEDSALEEDSDLEKDSEIEQALSLLVAGDFHHRWDRAKQFVKRFPGNLPIPALIHHLQRSSEPDHQWFLVRILGQYNQPVVVKTLAQFLITTPEIELQAEAIKSLTSLGNSAISTLSEQLQSNDLSQRRLAARALARIRRTAVIMPLLSIAKDTDAQLRLVAIEALGSFHDARITPILMGALTDERAIAIEAIRALGRRADLLPECDLVSALQRCLTHPDAAVAKESAIALGRLGTEAAATALGSALTQPAPTAVKTAAVRALGWLESASATAYLATAFECAPPVVMPALKQEIAKALGQSRARANKVAAAQPLVRWLQQHLEASLTMPPNTQPDGAGSPASNSAERTSQSDLSAAISPEELALKQTVITSLTWLGATKAIDSLILLLADNDLRIQMHALSALKQIDPKEGKTRVMRYLEKETLSIPIKATISAHLADWS